MPLDYYDIHIQKGKSLTIETDPARSVMLFTLLGDAKIAGEEIPEKTAVKVSEGDSITVEGLSDESYILFMSSLALKEPIAWGGPIVMNTDEEIQEAFSDLRSGNFIRQKADYETETK
ncbi:Pirin C-terminal cupin domain [Aedoeadaptatus ivorii]|uniref:Pirin C-terminal cupin domain n=1 Tax=Aedoeadaptatus ivorii TaxID=54006 RepID=A0A3S5C2Y3_9FIRM|nr:pirin-like C-terminal cupin domain-containing protein [Peptoniphilus ivorii]MDQ0508396.1 redox-sensitive bicupin YhaK (pirin superfamily) [Peptoniphilus ivorii]VEJ36364.1 Pirin C-terminal cupin domain [Peptoniphilus ivorii]